MARYAGLIGGAVLIGASFIPAFAPFAPALLKGGLLLAATGAISAITAQDPPSLQNARAAELQMATSAQGVPVPVFFGEQRLTGNFMEFDKALMRTVEVRDNTAGGKGGDAPPAPVVGFEYFLPYEYGICMGEVDAVAQVISTPGEKKLLDENPIVTTTEPAAFTTILFTRPAVNSTVLVTVGSTSLLAADNKVEIYPFGRFTVTLVNSPTTATLRLDERIGRRFGWGDNTVPSGSALLHITPTVLDQTRKLAFEDTGDFTVGKTITIDGSGEYTVVSILSGTSANCQLTRILGTGAIIEGTNVHTFMDAAQEFGTSDTMELTLAGDNEGGTVRLYCGSYWQNRLTSGDPYAGHGMNYRNLCWGMYLDYKMGNHPQSKSHHYILRRLPKCYRDDGSIFTALKARGSDDTSNLNYVQANPAAIIYEILTNKTWGRGLSSDLFDEASWESVSEFFAAQNIGLGITLDRAERLSNALAGIRETARILLLWDGDKLKIRTLLDVAETHTTYITITKSQCDNVTFTRPTWNSTINEVLAEFANRERNYKGDSVSAQDVANFNTVGAINQRRVGLTGVTDITLAQRLAAMILKESSYPLGVLNFEMNRTQSHLEPGDIIRFIWDEWSDGTVTGYYQVSSVKYGGSDQEKIIVSATEDPDLSAVEATETSVAAPSIIPWNTLVGNDDDDLNLTPPAQGNTVPIVPLAVFETPALLTGGQENRLAFIGGKPSPGLTGIAAYYGQYDADLRFLGTTTGFAVAGTITNGYPVTPHHDRIYGFQFTLHDEATDAGTILQANRVPGSGDDLSDLANAQADFIVAGEEIMQVGKVVSLGGGAYQASNLIRGLFGTTITELAEGTTFFFSRGLPTTLLAGNLEPDQETRFRGYPVDSKGVANIGSDVFIAHAAPNDGLFLGLGTRPLAPEPYSVTPDGGNPLLLTLLLRPQFYDRGAGTMSFERAANTIITNIEPMRFMVEALDGAGDVLQGRTLMAHTFTPDELDDPLAGMASIVYTMPGSTATVRVYSELAGKVSVTSAAFAV